MQPLLRRTDHWSLGLAGVAVVALGVRLALALSQSDFAHWPDGEYYLSIAKNLLRYGEYRNDAGPFPLAPLQADVGPTSFWLPGYPFLLAGVFSVFGVSAKALFVSQAVLGTGTVVLTGLLGRRLGGGLLGSIAAALVAISPLQLAQVTRVASETLAAFLFVLIVWLSSRTLDRIRDGSPVSLDLVLLGAAIGLGVLTRSAFVLTSALAFGVLAVVALRHASTRSAIRALALAGSVVCLVVAPWLARNWVLWDEVVYQTKSGVNLAIGFNDLADGGYQTSALPDLEQAGPDELVRDRTLSAEARSWIVANPVSASGLAMKKLAMFWSPFHDRHPLSTAAGLITFAWAGPLLIASIVGIIPIVRLRRAEWLPALVLTVGYASTHVAAFYANRFRVPVEPVLALLASSALVAGLRHWRRA